MEVIDPVNAINIILSLFILVFGVISYRKNRRKPALYIAITFGLFTLSHSLDFFGLREPALYLIVVIQIVAYLSIATAIYYIWEEKKPGFLSRFFGSFK